MSLRSVKIVGSSDSCVFIEPKGRHLRSTDEWKEDAIERLERMSIFDFLLKVQISMYGECHFLQKVNATYLILQCNNHWKYRLKVLITRKMERRDEKSRLSLSF